MTDNNKALTTGTYIDVIPENILKNITGQVSERSARIYTLDATAFASWLLDHNILKFEDIKRSSIIEYRAYLSNKYAKATAARMISVTRSLLREAVKADLITKNPADDINPFKLANETPHTALNKTQARELLAQVDRSRMIGKRNYAILTLLLRTGIRRAECAALRICDIKLEQGHNIAVIEHGKGDKRRIIKIPVDVYRDIKEYIDAIKEYNRIAKISDGPVEQSLFIGFKKNGDPTKRGISEKLIERLIKDYGNKIGVDLTPHGLRATFITLALTDGAKLEQVQYAAGHSDPRTTERYQKRKLNLDDNAVDYIKL